MKIIVNFFRKYCGSKNAPSEHGGSAPSSPGCESKSSKSLTRAQIHPVTSDPSVDIQPGVIQRPEYVPRRRANWTSDGTDFPTMGILKPGMTFIVEPPGEFTLDVPSDHDQDSAELFSRDFRSIELIKQRSIELNRDHTRAAPERSSLATAAHPGLAVEDDRGSSSKNLYDESLQVLKVGSIADLQLSSMQGQSTLSIAMRKEIPIGPPPPCSHCNNEHHSGYCKTSKRFSSEELEGVTDFSLDSWFDPHDEDRLFRGRLDGRPVIVARKESEETSNFISEIDILRYLRHPNIVTLRGYCDEDNSQALVFDFVCNRTLSYHLSSGNWSKPMPWEYRVNLAVELTKGLIFLHDSHIIHGNVSSLNVFVTHDFVPVIGEFSLSRCTEAGDVVILQDRSKDKKARGYLPPEYEVGTKLSEKVDVYAFGVILFELVTGRPAFDRSNKINRLLGEWGRDAVIEFPLDDQYALLESMADPRLKGTEFDEGDMLRMIKVATICTSRDPYLRPFMPVVLEMLMGDIDIEQYEAAALASRQNRADDDGEIVAQTQTQDDKAVDREKEKLQEDVGEMCSEKMCRENDNVHDCEQLFNVEDNEARSSAWRRLRVLFASNPRTKSTGGGRAPLLSPGPWYGRHDFKRPSTPSHYSKKGKPWRGPPYPRPAGPKQWSPKRFPTGPAGSGAGLAQSPRRPKPMIVYIKRFIPSTGPRSGCINSDRQKYRVTFAKLKSPSTSKTVKKRVK